MKNAKNEKSVDFYNGGDHYYLIYKYNGKTRKGLTKISFWFYSPMFLVKRWAVCVKDHKAYVAKAIKQCETTLNQR